MGKFALVVLMAADVLKAIRIELIEMKMIRPENLRCQLLVERSM